MVQKSEEKYKNMKNQYLDGKSISGLLYYYFLRRFEKKRQLHVAILLYILFVEVDGLFVAFVIPNETFNLNHGKMKQMIEKIL